MARATAAAPARAPRQRPAPRRTTSPRRRSGPAKAPVSRSLRPRLASIADALLHGRGWIALVAVLLVGIVFFNVDLLQMNRDIAQTASRASAIKRENAALKLRVAKLASTERIQHAAQEHGLVLPPPGQIRYLRARRARDGRLAARRLAAWTKGGTPAVVAPAPAPAPPPATPQPVAAQPAQPQAQIQQPQQPQQQAQPQAAPQAARPTGAPAAPTG
jgi:cell division protein FtsL